MHNKKWIYWLLGIILLFITCLPFFWNEQFDTSYKINHEKVSSFFSTVGAIVTAISLGLIYLQLNESKKQNEFSFQPALFIEKNSYKLKEIGENSITPKGFVTLDVELNDNRDRKKTAIKIINVGQGTALKIHAEWLFDVKEVKKITEIQYRSVGFHYKSSTEYLRTNEEFYIDLPYDYLNLFGIKLYPDYSTREKIKVPNKLFLFLKIRYNDLQHKCYEKLFLTKTESNSKYLDLDFEETLQSY